MAHTEPLDVYLVPDVLRQKRGKLFALLKTFLYTISKFFWNHGSVHAQVLICSLMTKIVCLTFCKNDLWIRIQKGHNIMDIIP